VLTKRRASNYSAQGVQFEESLYQGVASAMPTKPYGQAALQFAEKLASTSTAFRCG
jgi:hypothetical protein